MPEVILHIGTHKTATTSIQNVFAHNADLLAQHGIHYPRLGQTRWHHGITADWNTRLPRNYHLTGGSLGALQWLVQEYKGNDGVIFLSSEELSRADELLRPDLGAIRDVLSSLGRVRVLCTLREQWRFIQSVYLEVAKSRSPGAPRDFAHNAITSHRVDGLWTDYNKLYDLLLQTFSPSDITFMDFDQARRQEGGILGAILRDIGTQITAQTLKTTGLDQSNTSPGPIPTWAAGLIAAPSSPQDWLIQQTTGAFTSEYGNAPSTIFTLGEITLLRRHFEKLNFALGTRLAETQPGFKISASAPAEGTIHRDIIKGPFWLRCSRWMFNHRNSAASVSD